MSSPLQPSTSTLPRLPDPVARCMQLCRAPPARSAPGRLPPPRHTHICLTCTCRYHCEQQPLQPALFRPPRERQRCCAAVPRPRGSANATFARRPRSNPHASSHRLLPGPPHAALRCGAFPSRPTWQQCKEGSVRKRTHLRKLVCKGRRGSHRRGGGEPTVRARSPDWWHDRVPHCGSSCW